MDNFDLKKYLAEGKLFEQERYRKVTDDDQGLMEFFMLKRMVILLILITVNINLLLKNY